MSVEELRRFGCSKHKDATLQVLLLQLSHLLVHKGRGIVLFDVVFYLSSGLALHLGNDLDEDLEITRHHDGERIAVGLHLLEQVVNLLDLLLPYRFAIVTQLDVV